MLIYGGSDYYDIGLSTGIDPNITLVRYPDKKLLDSDIGEKPRSDDNIWPVKTLRAVKQKGKGYIDPATLDTITVAFCDKVYTGIRYIPTGSFGLKLYFWSLDKLRECLSKQKLYPEIQNPWFKRSVSIDTFFDPYPAPDKLRSLMIDRKISILLHDPANLHSNDPAHSLVNPWGLKKYGFASALDPYTAFQELSMWIGGVLGGNSPETVSITDNKVLIENHGYDKHSFRSSTRPEE